MGTPYDLLLTVALPNHYFQKIARQQAKQAIIPTVILLFLLIPFVWVVARRTAKPLLILKDEANSIRHFNFATFPRTRSRILEIDELAEAMMRTKQTICEFMSIGKAMAAKGRFDPLLTTILNKTIQAVSAHGGILYLLKKKWGNGTYGTRSRFLGPNPCGIVAGVFIASSPRVEPCGPRFAPGG